MKRSRFLTIRITEKVHEQLMAEKKRRIRIAVKKDVSTDGITVTSLVLEGIRMIMKEDTSCPPP